MERLRIATFNCDKDSIRIAEAPALLAELGIESVQLELPGNEGGNRHALDT